MKSGDGSSPTACVGMQDTMTVGARRSLGQASVLDSSMRNVGCDPWTNDGKSLAAEGLAAS